jgi:hypothetical protein
MIWRKDATWEEPLATAVENRWYLDLGSQTLDS